MLEINKLKDLEKYLNKKTNTYEFVNNNNEILDVTLNFNLDTNKSIYAKNIYARDLKVHNIYAYELTAESVTFGYYCITLNALSCKNIKSVKQNYIIKTLNGKEVN